MEAVNILLIVMIGFSGIIALLLGYQIKRNQSIEFISLPNLSLEKIKDKARFSSFAGNRTMMIGVSLITTAVIIGLLPQFLMMTILLLILLIAVISLEFIIDFKRYL